MGGHSQTGRHTGTKSGGHPEIQTYIQTGRHTCSLRTNIQKARQPDIQSDHHTYIHTVRNTGHTYRPTYIHTDRQTEMHTYIQRANNTYIKYI